MKVNQFKKIIKEAVSEAIREEFLLMREGLQEQKKPVNPYAIDGFGKTSYPDSGNPEYRNMLMEQFGLTPESGEKVEQRIPKTPKEQINALEGILAQTAARMTSRDLAAVAVIGNIED